MITTTIRCRPWQPDGRGEGTMRDGHTGPMVRAMRNELLWDGEGVDQLLCFVAAFGLADKTIGWEESDSIRVFEIADVAQRSANL